MIQTALFAGPLPASDLQVVAPVAGDPRIELVARWLNREWGAAMGYSVADTIGWCRGLTESKAETLIVASRSGSAVGVAALVRCDLPIRVGFTPWLSSLLVRPDERGRGTGTALAFAVLDAARRQGHEAVYLYARAGPPADYHEDRGFDRLEHLTIGGNGFSVMRRRTTAAPCDPTSDATGGRYRQVALYSQLSPRW